MRMIVIKQGTDLQALGTRLFGSTAREDNGLQHLQRLNPHIDFKKIEAGTVLFVPDQPGLKKGETNSVSGLVFDEFRAQVSDSIDASATRVREGFARLADERQEINAVLKSAAIKRLLEADPDLKPQLEAALQIFKQDQQDAKNIEKTLKTLQQDALAQLVEVGKLLG